MNLPDNLKKRLIFIQSVAIFNRFLRGCFHYLTFLFVVIGLIIAAEKFFPLSAELRFSISSTLPFVLILPIIFVLLLTLRSLFDFQNAAIEIERDSGMFDGYLASAVQLESDLADSRLGYSKEMIALLQERVTKQLQNTRTVRLIDWSRLRDSLFLFLVALMIYLSCLGISPLYFSQIIDKYWFPERTWPIVLSTRFMVEPGTLSILTGKDVEIKVRVLGARSNEVFMKYRYFGGGWEQVALKKEDESHFSHSFRSLLQSLEYYVHSPKARSAVFTINVHHEPKIVSQTVNYDYPAYAGLPPRKSTELSVGIEALYGTKITLDATANKPLKSAKLVFEKAEPLEIEKITKADLQVSFTAKHSDKAYLSIHDKEGLTNKNPVITPIIVFPDLHPKITMIEPEDDVDLDEAMRLLVTVKASDDFGIDRIELVAYRSEDDKTVIPIASYDTRVLEAKEEYLWDLGSLLHFPGDQLTFEAVIWDNDGVKGSKRGVSNRYRVRLPTMAEIYSQVETEQKFQESGLQSILEQQRYIRKKAASLYDSLKRDKSLNWTQKKELEEIARRQREIKQHMNEIIQQMSKTINEMSQKRVIKFSTLEKLKEIRRLFNEALTSEMRETLKRLNKAIESISLTEKQKELLAARFKAEDFEKRVERTLKLLKQMKNKQELDSLIKENQSIMDEQRRIQKDTMKLDKEKDAAKREQFSKELARREQKLAERLKKLKEQAEKLVKQMEETNPKAAEMLKDAIKQLEQEKVAEKMEEAAKSLKDQKFSEALKSEEQSLFGLFHFTKRAGLASVTMEVEEQQELLAAFQKLIDDSFYLSFQQEEFVKKLERVNRQATATLSKTELSQIAKKESFLSDSARKVIDDMQEIAEKSPALNYNLIFLLSSAVDKMKESVDSLEQKHVAASLSRSREAFKSINFLIAALMRQYRQLSNSSGGMSGGMNDSLENLSKQQEGMNDITQMLAEKLMRGESLGQAEEELLQQLAFEQSVVSNEMRNLMEEMERLGELLGQLGDAAKDSDEVSKAMKQKKLGKDILERQRRILTRLLDAQRSKHRQDKDKRRQAERPDDFLPQASPPPLDLKERAVGKDDIMPVNPTRNIPEPYKALVQEYFRRLSAEQ